METRPQCATCTIPSWSSSRRVWLQRFAWLIEGYILLPRVESHTAMMATEGERHFSFNKPGLRLPLPPSPPLPPPPPPLPPSPQREAGSDRGELKPIAACPNALRTGRLQLRTTPRGEAVDPGDGGLEVLKIELGEKGQRGDEHVYHSVRVVEEDTVYLPMNAVERPGVQIRNGGDMAGVVYEEMKDQSDGLRTLDACVRQPGFTRTNPASGARYPGAKLPPGYGDYDVPPYPVPVWSVKKNSPVSKTEFVNRNEDSSYSSVASRISKFEKQTPLQERRSKSYGTNPGYCVAHHDTHNRPQDFSVPSKMQPASVTGLRDRSSPSPSQAVLKPSLPQTTYFCHRDNGRIPQQALPNPTPSPTAQPPFHLSWKFDQLDWSEAADAERKPFYNGPTESSPPIRRMTVTGEELPVKFHYEKNSNAHGHNRFCKLHDRPASRPASATSGELQTETLDLDSLSLSIEKLLNSIDEHNKRIDSILDSRQKNALLEDDTYRPVYATGQVPGESVFYPNVTPTQSEESTDTKKTEKGKMRFLSCIR